MSTALPELDRLSLQEACLVLEQVAAVSPATREVVTAAIQSVILQREPSAFQPVSALPGASDALAKDKEWADMSEDEHTAAQLIGYDEATWDAGEVPWTCTNPWMHLSSVEQAAAKVTARPLTSSVRTPLLWPSAPPPAL